jgi:tetratricopeptide (TPR) repeat protein
MLFMAIQFLCPALGITDEEVLNDDQARQQCFKGKTIYCLALGIKEEKAGHQERALELFRFACKKHPTPGHLRACTPLLSLAWKMNRLDEEAAPLEARCKEGKPITCFYLGKEYLKLVEMEKAARHLEPLCRSHFRPPTSGDYGPCYHLAKGYEQAGQWGRARELLQFDCESSTGQAQPSCAAQKGLAEMEQIHRQLAQRGIRGFDLVEGVLLFVVIMSVLNVWIWFRGGRWGLKYLSLAAPVVVWGSALTWVYWPDKPEFPASQWAVVYFALLLVSGMAIFAGLRIRASAPSPVLPKSETSETPSQPD